MCRSVIHPCVLFLIIFWKLRQEQRKMDGGNCSFMTAFIFLGITDNTEDKATILTMVLIVYLIGHLANLRMIFLIKMDPQLHISMYFSPGHLSSVSSAIPLQFTPRWPWTYLPRTNQSPSMAVLCNSWSSLSLQILSVFCWQWWPMTTSTRPSAAPCSMWSACPDGCAPCSWLGFIWWEWQILRYTRH